MTTVYIEIYIATRRRLRERAKAASKVHAYNSKSQAAAHGASRGDQTKIEPEHEITMQDAESISSEANYNEIQQSRDENTPIISGSQKSGKHHHHQHHRSTVHVSSQDLDDESNTYNPENSSESAKNETTSMVTDTTKIASASPKNHHHHSHHQPHHNASQQKNNDGSGTAAAAAAANKRKSVRKTGGIHQFIEERQKISLSKERRAARVLGIVMGVFVCCWLPFFLMYVILPFCNTCCPSERLINFITWLGYINSALNPIIYTVFNMDFRKAFKKLLRLKI